MDDNRYWLESEMVNEENHIFEPLFSYHSKTMMLKMKVDIHVFSAVWHAITRKHYTTFTNFSMKYLVMYKVYTDVGGIK